MIHLVNQLGVIFELCLRTSGRSVSSRLKTGEQTCQLKVADCFFLRGKVTDCISTPIKVYETVHWQKILLILDFFFEKLLILDLKIASCGERRARRVRTISKTRNTAPNMVTGLEYVQKRFRPWTWIMASTYLARQAASLSSGQWLKTCWAVRFRDLSPQLTSRAAACRSELRNAADLDPKWRPPAAVPPVSSTPGYISHLRCWGMEHWNQIRPPFHFFCV